MGWQLRSEPTTIERVVGGLSYLTSGIAGIIYLLFTRNTAQSEWFRFHAYQSILLWLIFMLISWGSAPLIGIFGALFSLAGPEVAGTLLNGFGLAIKTISAAYYLLLLYGAIWAFLGKTAEVPFISNVVRQNMRF